MRVIGRETLDPKRFGLKPQGATGTSDQCINCMPIRCSMRRDLVWTALTSRHQGAPTCETNSSAI